jgi:hypothetical protein
MHQCTDFSEWLTGLPPKEQLAITENPACIPLPELSDEAQASILKSRLYRGFLHEMRQRTDFSEYLTGEH